MCKKVNFLFVFLEVRHVSFLLRFCIYIVKSSGNQKIARIRQGYGGHTRLWYNWFPKMSVAILAQAKIYKGHKSPGAETFGSRVLTMALLYLQGSGFALINNNDHQLIFSFLISCSSSVKLG